MTERIGQLFGHYRLNRLLDQGGFADVYLGEHVHLNTQAAIKILHTQLTTSHMVHFRNEARTIAHLDHPHIVRVLDFGVQENTPFLVMVYAPNGTLRQRHPRGVPLPAELIVHYVKQIASALQFAHHQRLIHRDIKPENMLLSRKDEVLLSDFGIALVTPSARAQSLFDQSRTSGLVGTLPYMAPEQIRGAPSLASDQYALAVVVYEWFCGTLPFNGMPMEVAVKHVTTLPTLLREKNPSIPVDVEKIVLTALAKDPQQRFASVQAFATALEQACQRQPAPVVMSPPMAPGFSTIDQPPLEAALYGPFGHIMLGSATVMIGRTPSNQLVIDDLNVSAHHAEIRPLGQGHRLINLNSTNGTFINEQALAPGASRPLSWGDMIRVGETKLNYAAGSTTQKKVPITTDGPTEHISSDSPGRVAPAVTPSLPPMYTGCGGGAVLAEQLVAPPPISPPFPQQPMYTPADSAHLARIGDMPPVQQNEFSDGSSVAGSPGNPIAAPVPTARPHRRIRWVALSMAVLLLLAGSAFGVLASLNSPSAPTQALDAFCAALQSKDDQTAYHQLSGKFQSRTSESLFAGFFANVASCTHGSTTQAGNLAMASLTTVASGQTSSDRVTLLQDSSSAWKIDDDTNLSGLTKTLATYCAALQNGDYATAYGQLSRKLQGRLSQAQFAGLFPQPSSCSYAALTLTTGGATGSVTTASNSGQPETNMLTLVLDSNSAWKIDDFTNPPDKTLDTFCNALQQGDYRTAYHHLSPGYQQRISEQQFATALSVVSSCTHDFPIQSGGSATANLQLSDRTGHTVNFKVFLIKDNNSNWKIERLH